MGYGTGTVPKREQILKDGTVLLHFLCIFVWLTLFGVLATLLPSTAVAEEIERRMAGMHPPLPQGAGDQADTSG